MTKSSRLWLREWVNLTIDSDALTNQITMAGLEVGGVEPVAGSFHSVVIGEVAECAQHPSVGEPHMMEVNVGGDHLLDIVCGVLNCRQGLRVAVVTIGAVLSDDFKIKAAKLRDEPSEGTLCSFSELRISNDHDGIIELLADVPIDTDAREHLRLNDNTTETSVTPSRADCLDIVGVVRGVAVSNQLSLVKPEVVPVGAAISDTLSIVVKAPDTCPRYLGRVVRGINAEAPTPLWMKGKLRRCGVHSIDVVVDVTNYVLLELGQPMHVSNKDRIEGGTVVRVTRKGETLVLLDGTEARLNVDTLAITDHNKALAMGGIFGGEHSDANGETQNVPLEYTFFNPLPIAGRARRHSLHTDASHRYKRGVDPTLQYKTMERVTRLLVDICSGEADPVTDIIDEAMLSKHAAITLCRSKLDRLIGYHITDEQVADILRRLGCEVTKDRDEWQAVASSWHFDVEIGEDLVEKITRVHGYNNIPDEPVQVSLIMGTHREADLLLRHVETLLNNKGYQEVITYSFVGPKVQQMIHPGVGVLLLLSPISVEMSVMRPSLWIGLLTTVVYDQNRQQNRVRIFESGLRLVPDTQAPLGVRRDLMLADVICGNRYGEHWNLIKKVVDFYDLKNDLEPVLSLTGKLGEVRFYAETNPALHPGQSVAVYLKGERIGFVGIVHPELERKLDLSDRALVFELGWSKLADRAVFQTREISRFPTNRHDIAVVVAENVPAADILSECKKVDVNQVIDVGLFDVYRGKGVVEEYKSLAISLILQNTSRILREEGIVTTITKCAEALEEWFQASLRD